MIQTIFAAARKVLLPGGSPIALLLWLTQGPLLLN